MNWTAAVVGVAVGLSLGYAVEWGLRRLGSGAGVAFFADGFGRMVGIFSTILAYNLISARAAAKQ